MSTPTPGSSPQASSRQPSSALATDRATAGGGAGRRSHATVGFWLSAAGGWAVIGYGLRGLLHHHVDTRPTNLARFAIGGALIHDLLFAPVLLAAGALVTRAVPTAVRGVVQAALIITGSLALFSYPLVRGYGHAQHNPSSLPRNYIANLGIVIAVVWAIAAAVALRRLLHPQRR